jgi:hypothetical protein
MNFLFKKDTTLKQKIAVVFILIVMISIIWGGFSHIIVNESLFIFEWSNYAAIVMTLIFLILLLKPNSTFKKNIEEQKKSIEMAVLAMLIAVPLVTKLACERGIPIILHTLTSKASQMDVIVAKQISNKGCRKGVKLIGYDRFANGKVCGLHDKFLSFAKQGTKLTLIGEESIFGFTMDKYRYQESIEQAKIKNDSTSTINDIIYSPEIDIINTNQDKVYIENNKKTAIQSNAIVKDVSLVGTSSLIAKENSKINSAYFFDKTYLYTFDEVSIINLHLFNQAETKFYGGRISFIYLYGSNTITIRKVNISAGAFSSPKLKFSGGAIFFTKFSKINIYARDVVYKNKKLSGKWYDGTPFSFTTVYVDIETYTDDTEINSNLKTNATKQFIAYLQLPAQIPEVLPSQIIINRIE